MGSPSYKKKNKRSCTEHIYHNVGLIIAKFYQPCKYFSKLRSILLDKPSFEFYTSFQNRGLEVQS